MVIYLVIVYGLGAVCIKSDDNPEFGLGIRVVNWLLSPVLIPCWLIVLIIQDLLLPRSLRDKDGSSTRRRNMVHDDDLRYPDKEDGKSKTAARLRSLLAECDGVMCDMMAAGVGGDINSGWWDAVVAKAETLRTRVAQELERE